MPHELAMELTDHLFDHVNLEEGGDPPSSIASENLIEFQLKITDDKDKAFI